MQFPNFKKDFLKFRKKKAFRMFVATVLVAPFLGALFGMVGGGIAYVALTQYVGQIIFQSPQTQSSGGSYVPQSTQEQKIIDAVKNASPSVVSIIITKNVPILEQYFANPFSELFGPNSPFQLEIPQYRQNGIQKQEVGGGSGFIVSPDGMILTNKHVVIDPEAEYTVFTNDGKSYPAKVLAKDPVQDLAVLKIEEEKIIDQNGNYARKPFVPLQLDDSRNLQIGQTVIAIGNALGEFRNTVSVGVISGLGRTITASDNQNFQETIENVIQTDAAINPGNSGGPLLNLAGKVVGINTATVLQAQSIGFAIPVNSAKKDIEQVKTSGKIVYPFLGVRYILINQQVKESKKLPVDYGALVAKGGQGESAVSPGSAAEKAGLKEGDIILQVNGEKITPDSSLGGIIQNYNPGDKITLKILRGGKEFSLQVTLGERSE